MANRFCTSCGARLVGAANFCVECGAAGSGPRGPRLQVSRLSERYAPVFVLGVVAVVAAGAILYARLNPVPAPSIPGRPAQGEPAQGEELPSNHPPIAIPEEVKKTIREMAKKAEESPADTAVWKQLAEVQYRAGQLEPQYLADAEKSYRHLAETDPGSLDALRGLGNVAYDQSQPGVAIKFYEQYLDKKPDDLEVRTDLGTMFLSTNDPKKAIEMYDQVLKVKPDFFQAHFNSAIAFRQRGEWERALASLEKARGVAPDDATRSRVEQLLARMKAEQAAPAATPREAAATPGAAPAPAGDFRSAAEALFRQNPVMGPRVRRVEWSNDTSARVFVRDFPMDQMGEGMKAMFVDRMKGRLREQKEKFSVGGPVSIEVVDEASGRAMTTLTE